MRDRHACARHRRLRAGPAASLPVEAARDAAGMQAWFDIWDGPIEIEYRDLVIECGGEIALAHSLNRMRGTRKGGAQVDFWMRSTLGFRRIDSAWKISHGHTSVRLRWTAATGRCSI